MDNLKDKIQAHIPDLTNRFFRLHKRFFDKHLGAEFETTCKEYIEAQFLSVMPFVVGVLSATQKQVNKTPTTYSLSDLTDEFIKNLQKNVRLYEQFLSQH
jgi:hypothetical protein